MRARSPAEVLCVAVIADNPDTLDGLRAYLSDAGVATHAARALRDLDAVSAPLTAVVLFPDDFAAQEVATRIGAWRSARPKLLILLVTGTPQRFRAALDPDGESVPPIVLPKPAFGWTILDAIRAHAQPEPEPETGPEGAA